MSAPLVIDYYTDVLCVYAWIAQRRIQELRDQWGDRIEFRYKYLNLFGDTASRLGENWKSKGGYAGFGQHVIEAASQYEEAPVSTKIWQDVQPATSATAHLVLKAVEQVYSQEASALLSEDIRRAFFVDCVDIGLLDNMLAIAEASGFEPHKLEEAIRTGKTMASLMSDYQAAQDNGVKGSPSWVMNNGRQILFGNVGYRILSANIEETISRPEHEASWC